MDTGAWHCVTSAREGAGSVCHSPCPISFIPSMAEGSGTGVGSQHPLFSQRLPRLRMHWEQGQALPSAAAMLTAQGK